MPNALFNVGVASGVAGGKSDRKVFMRSQARILRIIKCYRQPTRPSITIDRKLATFRRRLRPRSFVFPINIAKGKCF